MEIKRLSPEELDAFTDLLVIFADVFETGRSLPAPDHLRQVLAHPGFMVFVVLQEGRVAGGLTVHLLPNYYGEKPVAYIYDVAIAPAWQGRGLGRQLMAEVCTFFRNNGYESAYVEAEEDDADAIRFYRQTDFSLEMGARHFTYQF